MKMKSLVESLINAVDGHGYAKMGSIEKIVSVTKRMISSKCIDKDELDALDAEGMLLLDEYVETGVGDPSYKERFVSDVKDLLDKSREKLKKNIENGCDGDTVKPETFMLMMKSCEESLSKMTFRPFRLFEENKEEIKKWLYKVRDFISIGAAKGRDNALSFASHVIVNHAIVADVMCSNYISKVNRVIMSENFWKNTSNDNLDLSSTDTADIFSATTIDTPTITMTSVTSIMSKEGMKMPAEYVTYIDNTRVISKMLARHLKERYMDTTSGYSSSIMEEVLGRKVSHKESSKIVRYHNMLVDKCLSSEEHERDYSELINYIKEATSDFFKEFSEVSRRASVENISPLEINPEILINFVNSELWQSHNQVMVVKLQEDFPLQAYSWLTAYVLFWASFYSRLFQVWYGTNHATLSRYLEENHPEFLEYADRPIALIGKRLDAWKENYTNMKSVRETLDAAAKGALNELEMLERLKKEAMAKQEENKRKKTYTEEGFTFLSESGKIEKWVKENTVRIFFKTTDKDEIRSILSDMDELGLTSSRVRNTRNPAGVTRRFILDGREIYSDTILESSVKNLLKPGVGVIARPEDMMFEEYLLDLAYDKTFFSLEWLDEAIVRASQGKLAIKDVRYLSSIARNKGIIGQVKTKKSKEKVFSLTPEGYCLYNIKKEHPELPVTAVRWEDQVGQYLSARIGKDMILDVVTAPVKDIDKMLSGKAPKFMDKYYVSLI